MHRERERAREKYCCHWPVLYCWYSLLGLVYKLSNIIHVCLGQNTTQCVSAPSAVPSIPKKFRQPPDSPVDKRRQFYMEKNNTEKEQEHGRKAMDLEEWQCICGSSRKEPGSVQIPPPSVQSSVHQYNCQRDLNTIKSQIGNHVKKLLGVDLKYQPCSM